MTNPMTTTAGSPAARRPTALLADDEPHQMRALAAEPSALWPESHVVHQARQGLEATERIAALQPDLAFPDIQMPGLTGLEVVQGIEGPTRVIFVTAYDEHAVAAFAFEHEALDDVPKPVSRERLARTCSACRRRWPPRRARARALQANSDARLMSALQRPRPGASMTPASLCPCAGCARAAASSRTPLAGTRRGQSTRLFLRIKGHGAELPVSRAYVHLFRAMQRAGRTG